MYSPGKQGIEYSNYIDAEVYDTTPPQNYNPGHDTKLYLMVKIQLWKVWNRPSLPLLPGPLLPELVVPAKIP